MNQLLALGLLLTLLHLNPAPAAATDAGEKFRLLYGEREALAGTPSPLGWWTGFRNGLQNRGLSAVRVRDFATLTGRQPASFATKGLIWGTPVIDPDGNVYVGSADKVFYALTAGGQLRWSYTLPDAGDSLIDSAATLTPNGLVVVPGGDGHLHALERSSGRLVWRFAAHHSDDHESGVVVNSFEGNVTLGPDGHLYAGSDNGHLYSVDLAGKERWSFRTGMMVWSAPAFDPSGRWLAFGSLDRRVYVLECATGRQLASFECSGVVQCSPAVDDQANLYVGCSDFAFRCLALGRDMFGRTALLQRWKFQTQGEIYSSAALAGDRLVFGSHDGYVYCLTTGGRLLWKYGVHARLSASPLISQDGVVLVGAKNGKLYALDLETGQRLWSFKTAVGLRKVNLDSSPALGPDGRVHVGSYDGRLYSIPVEFAAQNPGDARCELRPGDDVPEFDADVPDTGATLRYVDAAGNLCSRVPGELGPESTLTLRLVARDRGAFVPNGALAANGLTVTLEPPAPVETVVGSDGYCLNITPKGFWKPGVRYRLTVRGRWYRRGNPFVDLLKWWGLPEATATCEFAIRSETGALPATPPGTCLKYGVRNMYINQPEVLDTLVPAAMEGQAFIASVVHHDREQGRLGLLLLPAFPRPDGVVLRAAPEKVFFANGWFSGDSVRFEGRFRLAAMGAEIPFEPIRMSGRMTADRLVDGHLHATAPVLGIRGNGSSRLGLSWTAVDDLADSWLRLQAVGSVEGQRLLSTRVELEVNDPPEWVGRETMRVTVRARQALEGEHLLTVMALDVDGGRILRVAAAKLGPLAAGAARTLTVNGIGRPGLGGPALRWHLDGDPALVRWN